VPALLPVLLPGVAGVVLLELLPLAPLLAPELDLLK